MRPRHVPLRTCVACHRKAAKGEFVRVVRTGSGEYLADPPRGVAGRGAYLCRKRECWDIGLARGALARGLRGPASAESAAALAQWACKEFGGGGPDG